MFKTYRPYLAGVLLALCLLIGITHLPTPSLHAQTQVPTINGLVCQSNTQFGGPAMTWVLHELFVCPADTPVWTPVLLKNNTAFGTTGMGMCHAQYNFANDGGAVSTITPLNNCTIPTNSIIYNAALDATTALTCGGSGTMAIGVSSVSSGTAILFSATGCASLTGEIQSVIVPQTASGWKKTSGSGNVTFTVGTAPTTAGIVEVYVMYLTSST